MTINDGAGSEPIAGKIQTPTVRRLFDDWEARKRGKPLPSWGAFDPVDLKYILGHLMLLDVERGDPLRFRYRVFGSKVAAQRGYDLTGQYVDDLPAAERRDFLNDKYAEIAETGLPLYAIRDVRQDGRKFNHEILSLPLASDGRTVDKILVAVIPTESGVWL